MSDADYSNVPGTRAYIERHQREAQERIAAER